MPRFAFFYHIESASKYGWQLRNMWCGFVVQKGTIDQRRALNTVNEQTDLSGGECSAMDLFSHTSFSQSGKIGVINR